MAPIFARAEAEEGKPNHHVILGRPHANFERNFAQKTIFRKNLLVKTEVKLLEAIAQLLVKLEGRGWAQITPLSEQRDPPGVRSPKEGIFLHTVEFENFP